MYSNSHTSFLESEKYTYSINTRKIGGIRIVKKKEVEPSDPHVREAYLAEGKERYTTPTPTFILPTPIPMQLIAPIPVPNLTPAENRPSAKNELLTIHGINKKTASQLEKLGINNFDDLANASAQSIAMDLKVDLPTAQKWISTAKKFQ